MALDRLGRHARWIRHDGIGRVLEEKELHPVLAGRRAVARARWQLDRGRQPSRPGGARPVWVVGLQRSGTNMVVRAFRRAPEFVVHNESDPRAFRHYRLRDESTVCGLVRRARAEYVVFKPLCDSHRTRELLALGPDGRAVWLWRDVDDRVRSALRRFGDVALEALRSVAAVEGGGSGAGRLPWQGEGLSDRSIELIRSTDLDTLSAASAQALLWVVRNELVFEQGLAGRPDVLVCCYDDLVRSPRSVMARVFDFLDAPFREDVVDGMAPRSRPAADPLAIDPEIRVRCDDLTARLRAVSGPVT